MRNKIILTAFALVALFSTSVNEARADFPYWYLYMGQSLLYPLTRSIGSGYLYGPYNSNPWYSTSSFLKRSAGYASQWPYVYGYSPSTFGNYGYRNAGMAPNYDATNNYVQDQSVYQSQAGQPAQPISLPATPMMPLAAMPYSSQPQAPQITTPVPVSKASTMPPKAPTKVSPLHLPGALGPNDASAFNLSATTNMTVSPIAEGFINHVVTKYDGNIQSALQNHDTRNWAKAMGLIDSDKIDGSHLSQDRLDTIGRILKDGALDPGAKIDTVKILLK